ncbi:MAG: CBS domain-containing protein [Oscillospiraceae bacterium]|nr:CBS domain-containing protein [Oscillospiraceae bacterium]
MTLRDIALRRPPNISAAQSLRRAWQTMLAENTTTLCVTDDAGALEGLITLTDVSTANLDGLDNYALAKAETPYDNVVDTLDGALLAGESAGKTVEGRIVIGAGSAEQMEHAIHRGDIVIVSNRSEGQLTAIEAEAGCLVVCTGVEVSRIILRVAEERRCLVVSTPHNVYATGQIIAQAAPVRRYMYRGDILSFRLDTPVAEAARAVSGVRHRYFPVLDEAGRCVGMVSHRNLMQMQ